MQIIASIIVLLGYLVWLWKIYLNQTDKILLADSTVTWLASMMIGYLKHTPLELTITSMTTIALAMTLFKAYVEKRM